MTWLKLDDRFARHPKVVGLSHFAFRVHVTALLGCAAHETDGRVDWGWLRPEAARGKPASVLRATRELVDAGLWEVMQAERGEPAWQIHDYLQYQPSRAQLKAKRAKAAERVNRFRVRNSVTDEPVTALQSQPRNAVTSDSVTPLVTLPPARPLCTVEEDPRPDRSTPPDTDDDLSPSPVAGKDLLGYLRGGGPTQRTDVKRLHAAWKGAFGYSGHRFRGYGDLDAQTLAEALDTYGEDTCHRVLREAPNDGMVNGTGDDRGQKHDTIRYIFGNQDAFNRILRAADERKNGTAGKRSASEAVGELLQRGRLE